MNPARSTTCPVLPLAAALTVAILAHTPAALAGTVHLDGLSGTAHVLQFVVAPRAGSRLAGSPHALDRVLRHAALPLQHRAGPAPRLSAVRRLAVGPMVVRLEQPLDPVQAEQLMRRLADHPDVEYVQTDPVMRAALDPDDPRLGEQWAFFGSGASLNVRPAWDLASGRGVVVAVLDTGSTPHPDLQANLLPGYDFISDPAIAGDGDGRDPDAADPGDADGSRNSSWHGTHVAGTVAAVTGNGLGVAGTAFGAKVQPLRVLGRGGGFASDIADAIVWAAGGRVAGVPDNPTPAQVINLSLGSFGTCDPMTRQSIDRAIANGATVVVAAGNSNDDVARYRPANCPGVIAVAATTASGSRASFSNHGSRINVAAPGQGILSTLNTGAVQPGEPGYAVYDGTSMAAPHVSGVVALMQSVAPAPLAAGQVGQMLADTARALPGSCRGGCGAGLVDAHAAVLKAREGGTSGPEPAELQDGVPLTGLSGRAGSDRHYRITVPAGREQLSVSISGGNGNADLSTRYGQPPTDTEFNCHPRGSGNGETCLRIFPDQGTWHVRIKAVTDYSGLSLVARIR